MRRAIRGPAGSPVTARVLWLPPESAEPVVTAYQLRGERLGRSGAVLKRRTWTLPVPERRTSATLRLASEGRWRFTVRAGNDVGYGPWSDRSGVVRAR